MKLHDMSLSLLTLSTLTSFCYANDQTKSVPRGLDPQLRGEWYRCIEDTVDSSVIQSYEETMDFQEDGTVENYYKFFRDDACEVDLTDQDREALAKEMKSILGDEDELEEMLLAASVDGFSYLARYQTAVLPNEIAALDITYEDDEDEEYEATEYLAYKFIGGELFVTESCDADDIAAELCSKAAGDSPKNRATDFEDLIPYVKLQ